MLILGENLTVIKQLQKRFFDKIQCIYLDPPYNSCNSFSMFDDSAPQHEWEENIRRRLDALWPLLNETGSIWLSIDDSEFADLKVLCDKLWGRNHFIACIIRQKNKYPSSIVRPIVHMHDYILVYAKNPDVVKLHDIILKPDQIYPKCGSPLENLLIWVSALKANQNVEDHIYNIKTPDGNCITPPKGRCWKVCYEQYKQLAADGAIWFDEKTLFPYIKHSVDKNRRVRPTSMWMEDEVGSNQEARYEIKRFDAGKFFYVPKPEKLLYRILSICTDPGDWVLDPYLGSGTTAAVAHKMSRKWIGIEQGHEQFFDICLKRLNSVIQGEDNTTVTEMTNWSGGGGFLCFQPSNYIE